MATSLPPGQTVSLNGMQMYYVLHGQGEPLVLLHGFTGSSNDWCGGGNTLLHMATQQPGRIVAMVLVSATSYYPEQARTLMRQFTIEGRTDEDWQFMRQSHKHGDEQIRAIWMHGHALKDSHDDMNFTAPYLSTITARTLIVYGDRDPLYPVHIAIEMYTAIPRSYLWIIPNGGHTPIFSGLNEPFINAVLPFLHGDWESE